MAEILFSLGLNLNNAKTKYNENIISGSLKEDKVESFLSKIIKSTKTIVFYSSILSKIPKLRKCCAIINRYKWKKIQTIKSIKHHKVLIAITLDIAIDNPRIHSCMFLLSVIYWD